MGINIKKSFIGVAITLCAMFITTSAQEYIYHYKDGEVTRKDTLFTNDGVIANEGKIQVIKGGKVAYETPATEVDSIAFYPLLKLKKNTLRLLLTQGAVNLDYTCSPAGDLKPEDLTWSSSNESVATVSEGVVTPIAIGQCLIEVKYGNRTVICTVEVKDAVNYYYVDLGLPSGMLWATCNIGASSPEEAGDHFLLGETEPREEFSLADYELYDVDPLILQKMGIVNSDNILTPEHDAATVNMGEEWRMPTQKDFDELIGNTIKRRDTVNGVIGYTFIGNTGNSIFLPIAGTYGQTSFKEDDAIYWGSYIQTKYAGSAITFSAGSNTLGTGSELRERSSSIRAVRSSTSASLFNISRGLVIPEIGQTTSLSFSSTPDKSISASDVQWSSSDESVATVKGGMVTSVSEGQCVITATYNGQIAKSNVTVDKNSYVDLGLPSGTIWASYNIGATQPEKWGYSLKWGSTMEWSNTEDAYKWNYYKYDDFLKNGIIDDLGNLTSKYDAATFNWGENWKMPSMAHFQELFNECDLEEIELNGVICTKVTSHANGASIYLPTAGTRYVDGTVDNPSAGYYRTSTMANRNSGCFAYTAQVSKGEYKIGLFLREYYGMSVRPIYAQTSNYRISLSLEQKELNLTTANSTAELKFTTTPANALTVDDITWTTSDKSVAFVNNGIIVPITAGKCVITAEYRGEKSTCSVTVTTATPTPITETHEYVDLGLPSGILWAKTDIGAKSEFAIGDLYSWGEFETKETYDAFQSPWYNVSGSELLELGVITEKKIDEENSIYTLSPQFDAATRIWGNGWRMPTSEEYAELYDNCTRDIIFKTVDGVSTQITVYKSKKNGNSIYRQQGGWSSDLYFPSKTESKLGESSSFRGEGNVIRPVREAKTE